MSEAAPEHQSPPSGSAEPLLAARGAGPVFGALGVFVRMVMIVPVAATFVTAVALIIYGGVETWHFVEALFSTDHPITRDTALLLAIEIVDLFLLATVVQVVALGLYQLYFRQDLRLPKWLKIDDLDDLKSKLVSVTVTVLAVYFLGQALSGGQTIGLLYLGGAAALVIAALTYFLRQIHD